MVNNHIIFIQGVSPLGHVMRAYLNIDKQEALKRFDEEYPNTSPVPITEFDFADEFAITEHGFTPVNVVR